MYPNVGSFGAIVWELISLSYMCHLSQRFTSIYCEFMLDSDRFTAERLLIIQEKIRHLELKEVTQAHDIDQTRIVIDPPNASNIRKQIASIFQQECFSRTWNKATNSNLV